MVRPIKFLQKTEVRYLADKDSFPFGGEEASHALVRESLGAVPGEKIESSMAKSNDPITQITLKCYKGKYDEAFKLIDDFYDQYKTMLDIGIR